MYLLYLMQMDVFTPLFITDIRWNFPSIYVSCDVSHSRHNILNLKHYVIMLIYPFAIFILYVVSKNGIYVMLYKYLSDSI
jgi:hypothetical protein